MAKEALWSESPLGSSSSVFLNFFPLERRSKSGAFFPPSFELRERDPARARACVHVSVCVSVCMCVCARAFKGVCLCIYVCACACVVCLRTNLEPLNFQQQSYKKRKKNPEWDL